MKKKWIAGLLSGSFYCFFAASTLFGQGLKGIYVGQIENSMQPGDIIPLQISLFPTNEYKTVNGTRTQVIDGAFLIDDEGGPFGFSDVKFEIATGHLELSYLRPQVGSELQTPNFKLEGKFNSDGTITGKVQALSSGYVGSFNVKQSNQKFLVVNKKYSRSWKGKLEQVDGQVLPFEISLSDSIVQHQNPPAYDFEYSRGRLGSYQYMDREFSATQVYVDYFKHEISIVSRTFDGGTNFLATMKLINGGKNVKGNVSSSGRGMLGTIDLNRVGG